MSESTHENVASRYLRKLSHGVAGARTGAVESATAEALSADRVELAHDRAIRSIERESGQKLDAESMAELDRLLLVDGKNAMKLLNEEGPHARLTDNHQAAIEAIVEVDGSRPTIRVEDDDKINLADETLDQWRSVTEKFLDQISVVASAVGRIDLDGNHCGTGFVVKDGLILTNRHVLQGLARETSPGNWEFVGEPTITFDANPGTGRRRHQKLKKKVVLAGSDFIDPSSVDYRKLDFAVLEIEAFDPSTLPAPLALETDADKIAAGRPIFTIGYPAKPKYGIYDSEVLQDLFQFRYGVKRFSPGEIDRGLGSDEEGTGETVFAHDSTTLGGNSGSCVVDFGNDGQLVVGLHFAGMAKTANYAHSNALLHEALDDLGLTWKEWI